MGFIMDGSESFSIQKILKQYGLKPHKGLGQNFLSDDGILEKIIDTAEISSDSAVLEIGPGLGSLTRHLARRFNRVVAVELDKSLIPVLKTLLSSFQNVSVIQGDILDFQPADAFQESYSVIANIPYYITSAVIRHLLESTVKPEKMILTVQKEVAERICAKPGKLSLLALSVQIYGETDMPLLIPAASFYPEPNVDSAVVRIRLYEEPRIAPELIPMFFRLAKAGYGQKRKTLRNSISANFPLGIADVTEKLQKSGIDPMRRAETLSIEEWNSLLREFAC
jgi:16S rRNA (adenine1518-N6/adenine1519-N6)-dimethyltransferase